MESLLCNLMQEKKIEAEIFLKQTTRDRVLFELEQERKPASPETERQELVNRKIQAETDQADLSSEDNVIIVQYALQIPGAIQPIIH